MKKVRTVSMNVYQREALKPIDTKYSPKHRKAQQNPIIQVVLKNPQLNRSIVKVKTQQQKQIVRNKLRSSALYASLSNTQKKLSLPSANFAMYSSTNLRKESLSGRNHIVRTPRQLKEFVYKKDKAANQRQRTQDKQLVRQQIQLKKKELEREKELKMRRQTSERSFVLETHKQTIDMMKRSKQIRSRSQVKLVKEKYKETQKDHQFLMMKQKKAYLQQKQQHQFHKAFIKNTSLPKFHYPNLADTLAIASKTLTTTAKPSHSKAINSQTTTKKGLPKQKLQPLKEQKRKKSNEYQKLEQEAPAVQTFLTAQEVVDKSQIKAQIEAPLLPDNPQVNIQPPNLQVKVQKSQHFLPVHSQNLRNQQQQGPKAVQ